MILSHLLRLILLQLVCMGVIGDILGDVAGEIKKIGQAAGAQVTGDSGDDNPKNDDSPVVSDVSIGAEAESFGKGIISQITGKKLAQMQDADREFSAQGQEEIKARINAMYSQYAQKVKREKMIGEQQEKQVEAQNKEFEHREKEQSADVAVAQTKANAEIKNLGAE